MDELEEAYAEGRITDEAKFELAANAMLDACASMVKQSMNAPLPLWRGPSSAPAPPAFPQDTPGGVGRLGTLLGHWAPRHWAPKQFLRVLDASRLQTHRSLSSLVCLSIQVCRLLGRSRGEPQGRGVCARRRAARPVRHLKRRGASDCLEVLFILKSTAPGGSACLDETSRCVRFVHHTKRLCVWTN